MVLRIVFFAPDGARSGRLRHRGLDLDAAAAAAVAAAPPPPAKIAVLVAARPLRAGSLLKPEDLAAKEIAIARPAAPT